MLERRVNIITSVARTYALAMVELVVETAGEAQLDEMADELREIAALTSRNDDLLKLISSRTLSVEQRCAILERLFKGRVSDLVFRFLLVVNEKSRLDQIESIVDAFLQLTDERRGRVKIDAYVAVRIDDNGAHRVASEIGKTLGKQVTLRQYEDPHLIGGLKLRIGDQLIDGSIATQLRVIREKLVASGREKAHTAQVGMES